MRNVGSRYGLREYTTLAFFTWRDYIKHKNYVITGQSQIELNVVAASQTHYCSANPFSIQLTGITRDASN
jgi:hypothetical protein